MQKIVVSNFLLICLSDSPFKNFFINTNIYYTPGRAKKYQIKGYYIIKMCEIKISVVTINLNNKTELESTVKSVILQDYKGIQYVIIDGGSTDGSIDVINKYSAYFHKIVIGQDRGIYDGMNIGIDQCDGDFLIFLNAGDCLLKNTTISEIVKKIDNKSKAYFARVKNFDGHRSWLFPDKKITIDNYMDWIKRYEPNHQGILFPKEFYKKNRYNLDYKISSDADYKLKLLKQCDLQFIDEIIVTFSIGGISNNPKKLSNVKIQIAERLIINKIHNRNKLFDFLMIPCKFYIKFALLKIFSNDFGRFLKLFNKIK